MQTPEERAAKMADMMKATLRALRAAVVARDAVELDGMSWEVGRLCAACLDLPVEQRNALRAPLQEVAAELDALQSALIEAAR